MALGILGILGVQMRTLTDTQTAVRRAQAIRLIEDLGERMKVSPNALANLNGYVTGSAQPLASLTVTDATQHNWQLMTSLLGKEPCRKTCPWAKPASFFPLPKVVWLQAWGVNWRDGGLARKRT